MPQTANTGTHSSSARAYYYRDIRVGMRESRDYVITPEVYERFLAAFQDYSPLHVDEDFAKSRGFDGRVMHGCLLTGFLSHFVGMHFPGRFSMLLTLDMRFSNPSYLGDSISLTAVVGQKADERQIVVLDATLSNNTRKCLAARGRLQVMIQEAP
jgi:acyl dehydratase